MPVLLLPASCFICFGCDGRPDLGLVDIHGVGADIHKHKLCLRQNKGRGSAGKCEAGKNHLVSGSQLAQQCGHIQRGRAGGGQEDLLGMEPFLKPGVAFLRELTIAVNLMGVNGMSDIFRL